MEGNLPCYLLYIYQLNNNFFFYLCLYMCTLYILSVMSNIGNVIELDRDKIFTAAIFVRYSLGYVRMGINVL